MKPRIVSSSFVLWCAALLLPACGDHTATLSADSPPGADARSSDTRGDDAGPIAALAYEPDDSPTGQRIAAAQRALREHPTALDAHLTLATLLMRRQRETSNAVFMRYAEDVIDAARTMAPDDDRVRLLHAMALQDGHRFEAAAEQARAVLAGDPNDATAHVLLADAQLELGDYEAAMDAVQSAVELHPDLRSYNRAAHLRWLMGDFDSALAIIELALDSGSPRDPESSAWCFVDLGAMYLARADAARAQAAADRALALVPDYLPAQILRARALARGADPQPGIEVMERAMQRRPSVEDLLRLAQWHEAAGNDAAAAEHRATADRLADDDPRPMALDLARRGVQTERAVKLARAELEARQNIAAHDALAMALARAGEHEAARHSLDRALALGTEDPELHLHAALVHALAGRSAAAREAFAHANRLDADADPRLAAELRRRLGAA